MNYNVKKRSLIIVIILALGIITGCRKEEKTILDAFENMEVSYVGWNKNATAKINNKIYYTGKNESIKKFIKEIDYSIKPSDGLKNGDKIEIQLQYIESNKEMNNIEFKKEKKTFIVKGLHENTSKVVTNENTYIDDDGNEKKYYTQDIVIGDVKIPAGWNLTPEETQAYLDYLRTVKDDENAPKTSIKSEWIQGNSEKNTHRKKAKFLTKDYVDNSMTAYNEAYKYGMESSQLFKIVPIIKDGVNIGYDCIFKE